MKSNFVIVVLWVLISVLTFTTYRQYRRAEEWRKASEGWEELSKKQVDLIKRNSMIASKALDRLEGR